MTGERQGGVVRRNVRFQSPMDKARWLDENASIDAARPYVRDIAIRIARTTDPNDPGALARAIHQFVRNAVHYVHDPSQEEFADTETILRRGADDCDGKARAFVALCRAVKLTSRIRPVFADGKHFSHVQGEVRWPGSETHPRAQADGWLVSDPILKGSELGDVPQNLPKVGGKWLLV